MNVREFFASEIETVASVSTPGLVAAFAAVPRERFLGPGPWTFRSDAEPFAPARVTVDANPERVYHNIAIAIDPARQLFNGAPSLLASWIEMLKLKPGARVLHVGCGTGYYTSIMGQVVGPTGSVEGVDVDRSLVERAKEATREWPWISIRHGDGSDHAGALDGVLLNAGATHPRQSWLDALNVGGKLVLPLTVAMPPGAPISKGVMLLVTKTATGFDARFVNMVAIFNAEGLRDPKIEEKLGLAMRRGDFTMVKSLRLDAHEETPECWMHTSQYCLSRS